MPLYLEPSNCGCALDLGTIDINVSESFCGGGFRTSLRKTFDFTCFMSQIVVPQCLIEIGDAVSQGYKTNLS